METIRDSAFGKLVRIFSQQRLFQYPEEAEQDGWKAYLKSESPHNKEGFPADTVEGEALFTSMSQALHRVQTLERVDTTHSALEKSTSSRTLGSKVIGWRDDNDSEVRYCRSTNIENKR